VFPLHPNKSQRSLFWSSIIYANKYGKFKG
jgi:hypothetical protein